MMIVFSIFTFAQGADSASVTAPFPIMYFIPLFLGMLFHWLKGYTKGTIGSNLWDYILTNLGMTITAIVVAVGQLITAWTTSPQLFTGTPIATGWFIFLMGYGSDSMFNSEVKKVP